MKRSKTDYQKERMQGILAGETKIKCKKNMNSRKNSRVKYDRKNR